MVDGQTGAMRLFLLRLLGKVWRFRTLALSTRAFDRVSSPCVLKRRFLGYSLHLDVSRSNAQRMLYVEGGRFVSELKLIRNLVEPTATVVDVGANIGYYVLLFAKSTGEKGRIIAFEPEPDNLVELRLNVERNGLRNVEIHPFAVGSKAGTVEFARGINGGVKARDTSGSDASIQVPIVALDEILNGPIDLIKMDVEGYEGEVLHGAGKCIERWRPDLFVEIHPGMIAENHTVDSILEFLEKYYSSVTLYQPSRHQSVAGKIISRYFGIGSVERLPSPAIVASLCRQGLQDTFWAVCVSPDKFGRRGIAQV